MRLVAIVLILYYRCIISTLHMRTINERDDSYGDYDECSNQHSSLVSPETTSIVTFGGNGSKISQNRDTSAERAGNNNYYHYIEPLNNPETVENKHLLTSTNFNTVSNVKETNPNEKLVKSESVNPNEHVKL